MTKDSKLELAAKWFEKLNQPSSGMYQISHAGRINSAVVFEPAKVLEMIRRTKRERVAEHRLAVADFTAKPQVRRKKK